MVLSKIDTGVAVVRVNNLYNNEDRWSDSVTNAEGSLDVLVLTAFAVSSACGNVAMVRFSSSALAGTLCLGGCEVYING